uniref:HEAT repeat-containing protein 6 n=1 Tax=Rhodnius prolixus TaxID=13249 RepID=T1IB20_RHOPR
MDVASFNFNAAIAELNSFLARKDYETQAVNAILDKLNSLDFTFISPDAKLSEALIKANHSSLRKHEIQLFNALIQNLESNANVTNPNDIKLMRISCLQSLAEVLSPENNLHLAKAYIDILYAQPTSKLSDHYQVWLAVLEALDALCAKSSKWLETLLSDTVGIIIYGTELGLNGKLPPDPKSVYPSSVAVPPPQNSADPSKVNLKVKKKQKNKVKQVGWSEKETIKFETEGDDGINYACFNTSWLTSDSDISDSEGNQVALISKGQAKVVGCKVLYEYYGTLLGKLTFCVKNEKLSKPKIAAMAAINALLTDAKPFLAQAQHSEGVAFTTFSEVLSELVTGLHSTLGGLLSTVPHMSVAVPLLHTTATLISATPYHRLRPALLTNLFKAIYLHKQHKDPTVRVGVLHCISEIVILNPVISEQKEIILFGINDGTCATDCWVLNYCFSLLKEPTSSDIRVACWQILGGMCQCHFELITSSFSSIENFIFQDLNAPNKPMIYAAKTLEHLLSKLVLEDEFDAYRKELWMKLLEGPFVSLIESSRRAAAIACDCLSNIGAQVFNALKEEKQILIITLIYGCCYSEVVVVRGSAVNTLGVFLLFPQLTIEQFIHDTKDILIKRLKDESDYVRTKAAWAFGNLVDLLIENQDKEFVHEISLIKLLEAALLVANDSNRVKANILRAVGNLLLLITKDQLCNSECKVVVEKAVQFCLTSSNTGTLMKMRWNACYAIGTLLQNDALYGFSNKWLGPVISSLCNLLVKCNNFKVRANACSAICSIKKREYFGTWYILVWVSLLDGLDNAANMPDFKEFKHQDHLFQQLCCAICHVASLIELDDISNLQEILLDRIDVVKTKMLQFQNSAPPEKSGTLLTAYMNINVLLKMELEKMERMFLLRIQKIFTIA